MSELKVVKHNIFPTSMWIMKGAPQQLIDELYQGVYKITEKHTGVVVSNQGGYQSPGFRWEDFHQEGKEYIKKAISTIITNPYEITGWWFNISPKDAWNLPHTHPGSDFALVWYLTDSDGLLTLMNDHPQRLIESGPENGHYMGVDANKGDIVIFPADIHHYVLPNKRDTDRISISLNIRIPLFDSKSKNDRGRDHVIS